MILEEGGEDEVGFDGDKKVTLNSRVDPSSLTAAALHECGHILIYEARCRQRTSVKKKSQDRPIAGSSLKDNLSNKRRFATNTCKRKVAIVTEEIDAWERGWELGKRLRIRISKTRFENSRIKALMTYMRWVTPPERKKRK